MALLWIDAPHVFCSEVREIVLTLNGSWRLFASDILVTIEGKKADALLLKVPSEISQLRNQKFEFGPVDGQFVSYAYWRRGHTVAVH